MQSRAQARVAVFGGSFNPVHEGHLGIVRALASDGELAAVIVMPARRSPFKRATPGLPDAVRWDMLRQALRGIPRVWLSDIELRAPAPSYTADTLCTLASVLPGASLHFALGWDAFAEFARWHRASALLAVAGLIVFDRAGDSTPKPTDLGADWARLLPAPWNAQARPADAMRLVAPDGRVLVRHMPLALPAVAARDILGGQSLEGVPAGAREVLAAYWGRPGRG